jgi:hypothetical protein
MKADTSLLKRGEDAIVVFTHGEKFKIHSDRSGSTGNWILNQKRGTRKVIIYERTARGNDIYVAKRKAVQPSRDGRYIIHLQDVRYFGTTYFNWLQFSGSRHPIRYWNTN